MTKETFKEGDLVAVRISAIVDNKVYESIIEFKSTDSKVLISARKKEQLLRFANWKAKIEKQ